jgi:hypothetical protein
MRVPMFHALESIPLMIEKEWLEKLLKRKKLKKKPPQLKKLPLLKLPKKRKPLKLGKNSTARLTLFKTTIASN